MQRPTRPTSPGSSCSRPSSSQTGGRQASTVRPASSALSARVIPSLEEAQSYEAVDSTVGFSASGEFLPPTSRKRQFPKVLRRLRDRLQTLENRLRLDVNELKQEIAGLNVQRSVLQTKTNVQRKMLREKAVETVVEYYGAFQFGWILPMDSTDTQGVDRMHHALAVDQQGGRDDAATGSKRFPETRELSAIEVVARAAFVRERQRLLVDRQKYFLEHSLHPSMDYGPAFVSGVDAFADQWTSFSRHHDDARLSLTSMSVHGATDGPIVTALGSLSGYVTNTALEDLYPHVLADPAQVTKLVGTFIRCPCREFFAFDEDGRVLRYDIDVDCVVAFQDALCNLRDVASILSDGDGNSTRRIVEGMEWSGA